MIVWLSEFLYNFFRERPVVKRGSHRYRYEYLNLEGKRIKFWIEAENQEQADVEADSYASDLYMCGDTMYPGYWFIEYEGEI